MFKDLREFIEQIQEMGELRIFEGVDPDLELGTINELMTKPGAPALLFDKIKGCEPGYRIVSNLVASHNRVALLLGMPAESTPMEMVKEWRRRTKEGFKPVPPKEVETGPVKENILTGDEVDLFKFPVPLWHEDDGGRYIGTGDIVITKDPEEGWVNAGTYRVQMHDKNTATVQIDDNHHGNTMRQKYWDMGKPCPTAVVCGMDPTLLYVGGLGVPWGISEYDYAGWMKNQPIEVVRGETTDLPIPATAEIVLEGEMVPPEEETRVEGPFGEYCGYYASHAAPEIVFRVKSILHRNNPILLGDPPYRVWPIYVWGRNIAKAALIWDQIETTVPWIKGVWVIEEATVGAPVVSIRQMYGGHAKAAGTAAQAAVDGLTRFVIVVDDDIDPSNISDVIWALGTRWDPANGIDVLQRTTSNIKDPLLTADQRKRNDLYTSTAIITACKPFGWIDEFPKTIKASDELIAKTKKKWGDLLNWS